MAKRKRAATHDWAQEAYGLRSIRAPGYNGEGMQRQGLKGSRPKREAASCTVECPPAYLAEHNARIEAHAARVAREMRELNVRGSMNDASKPKAIRQ